MERIIFHIDVNSAYLSWSAVEKCKKNPTAIDLRTIPSIIGGDPKSRHGIVLAKSTPAKKYGIKTAEPIAQALKKCPFLTIEPADHQLYRTYSEKFIAYLHTLTSQIEQVSVDECYLDFTGIAHLYESPTAAADMIRQTIFESFGFTVNVGISTNKLLAKMASDFQKPNRTHTLYPHEIQAKMWPLPVSELFMAGHASVKILNKLEILTIGDLAKANPQMLETHLKSHGRLLWEYANGMDDSPVESEPAKAKGIGNSTTLPKDVTSEQEAKKILYALAQKVASRLKASGQCASSICVEIKYHTFISVSHQMGIHTPTNQTEIIYKNACLLFDALWDDTPIRLLGIRTTKLTSTEEPVQMNLFDLKQTKKDIKKEKLEAALQKVRTKYGETVVQTGNDMINLSQNAKKEKPE